MVTPVLLMNKLSWEWVDKKRLSPNGPIFLPLQYRRISNCPPCEMAGLPCTTPPRVIMRASKHASAETSNAAHSMWAGLVRCVCSVYACACVFMQIILKRWFKRRGKKNHDIKNLIHAWQCARCFTYIISSQIKRQHLFWTSSHLEIGRQQWHSKYGTTSRTRVPTN